MTRIESLEKDLKQTKQTMGNAIVKLVKKVKKMEKVVKSRRVVITDSEDEAAKNSSKQERNLQKDKSETKKRNVKTGVRRRLDVEDVSTGFEDVSTGFTDIKSASEKVSSGGEHVSASQREGKALLEETPQTKRTKKQIREEHSEFCVYCLGGWKLAQIKKLIDEELKEKFEYLMRSMERFVPMDTEKESRKKELCRSSNRNFQEAKKRALNLQSTGTEEDVEADNGERVDESIFRRADDVEVMEISRPEENLKGVLMGGIKRLCIDPPSEEMIFGSVPHH
ncbi:hypothetical protein Tco_0549339 [Tanacetum coccineum]